MNVSFPPGVEGRMRRWLKIEPALWPWWDGDMPRVVHLAAAQRARLADLVAALPPVDLGIIEQS